MNQRVYIDTSVIGGCEDEEFSRWSLQLSKEFRQGLRIAIVSDLTREEIEKAPKKVREILSSIPETNVESVFLSEGAEALSKNYIDEEVVTAKHISRCTTYCNSVSRTSRCFG